MHIILILNLKERYLATNSSKLYSIIIKERTELKI